MYIFFYVWRSVGFLDPWLNSFSCRGRSEGFSVYVWVKIRKKDVWILLTWQQIKRSMAHVMKVCEYSLRAVADCCFSREEIKQKYPILLYLRTLKLSVQLLREPCHFVCCLVSSQPSEMATDKHKDWGARRRYCCLQYNRNCFSLTFPSHESDSGKGFGQKQEKELVDTWDFHRLQPEYRKLQ